MKPLASFVCGSWRQPSEQNAVTVLDAVTGAPLASVSSGGIDTGAMLEYGRRQANTLRSMTFRERGRLLSELARDLRTHREELYLLSRGAGSTLYDAKYDIDGGIRVLDSYAELAGTLPDSNILLEDEAASPLTRHEGFVGRHVLTPLRGVAIQINAYNFPVWAPLEKLAPAFLAGVPSIVKPSTQTAYLTTRLVELIVGSGILPAGAVQLIVGSVAGLLDQVTGQDTVSFTGSAATAGVLRAHPKIIGESVRLNVEADSLNCSVLGLDGTPGTSTFDHYVTQLFTEMTVKTGQKCTAIRRAIVPAGLLDDVAAAVSEKLGQVVIGDPANPEVTMGALVSLHQRDEVRRAVEALRADSRIVFGDPEKVDCVDADPARGAFLSPMLLHCDDGDRPAPHRIEPFGPVSTLLPYRTADDAVELAARGQGSLAGSVVSNDPDFLAGVAVGLAPWHGRLLLLDDESATGSTGHGAPLPSLVHGGPGRAGGGEELGGIRAVVHHMQRTAIQSSPRVADTLSTRAAGAVTGGKG